MTASSDHAERSNQELWDEIAPVHYASYREVDLLRNGHTTLDEIELREVGQVRGKTLLHLQCHIGTDTLSWARAGAIAMGVDFSAESIALAWRLSRELGIEAAFHQSNVYDLQEALPRRFDIVYTSRGVLCWLRDLDEWARIIASHLVPGGFFYIMETHPICNIFDATEPGELAITHPYFHRPEPTLWDDDGPDYADPSYIPRNPSYEWDWSVSDILNALIKAGLQLEFFNEYGRLFFKCFAGMESLSEGWYHFPQYDGKLPLLFTLKARKPPST